MKLTIAEASEIARRFAISSMGRDYAVIESIEPIEANKQWRVVVNVGIGSPVMKEVIIDDETRNVVSFKESRTSR